MVFAEAHLAAAEEHSGAFDAADVSGFQGDAGAGDVAAGRGEDGGHAGAGIGRAADDGDRAGAGVHLADAEAVGIGVLHGLDHAGDAEGGEGGARVFYAFKLQADGGEAGGDLVQGGRGVEVGAEPGFGELHAAPSCRATGARGLKP